LDFVVNSVKFDPKSPGDSFGFGLESVANFVDHGDDPFVFLLVEFTWTSSGSGFPDDEENGLDGLAPFSVLLDAIDPDCDIQDGTGE